MTIVLRPLAGLIIVLSALFLNITESRAQVVELTWNMLSDVTFKDVYLEEYDIYYYYPTFGPQVLDMEGREVKISGYVIPVDYDEDYYVLSAFPFAQCFFCGGAGPESVIDLRLKEGHATFKTDERRTFRGVFSTNTTDIYSLNYILEDAEVVD